MKDANEILRQKEADLARVRREVESLRIAAGLITDEEPNSEDLDPSSNQPGGGREINAEEEVRHPAEATGTDGLFSTVIPQRARRWSVLRHRRSPAVD